MTHPAAAWNENHGRGTYLRHEKRIVIRAADHAIDFVTQPFGGARHRFNELQVANRRRVDVQPLYLKFYSAALADFRHSFLNSIQCGIARGNLGIAQIDFEPGPTGDAVDRSGFDAKDTRRRHSIRAAGIESG